MMESTLNNAPVEEVSLPKASELTFKPLEKSYITVLYIPFLAIWFALSVAGSIIFYVANKSILFIAEPLAALPVIGLLLFILFYIPHYVKACGLSLRHLDIHFKSGVLWRKVISLPFNRIQHVELESGPLDRAFKLATLKIYTAGGGATDMRIPGLKYGRASKLRSAILSKAGIDSTDTETNTEND